MAGVLLFVFAVWPLLTVLPAIAACAEAGPNCHGKYKGLYARLNEEPGATILGEINYDSWTDNKNRRITNDPDGDRQVIQGELKDRRPANGNPVYAEAKWWINGSYCYTSLVGISAGQASAGVQIGTGCTNGYYQADDHTDQSTRWSDNTWFFFCCALRQPFVATANSSRAKLHVCEAQAWAPDDCVVDDGGRLLGVRY